MECAGFEQDYPRRVMTETGTVVHAAYARRLKPSRYERTHGIDPGERLVKCCDSHSFHFQGGLREVDPKLKITCKNCLRIMGILKDSKLPTVLALKEIESGYYAGPEVRGTTRWVETLRDAALFKTVEAAQRRGQKGYYYNRHNLKGDVESNRITIREYRNLSQNEKYSYNYSQDFDSARYKVVAIQLSEVEETNP